MTDKNKRYYYRPVPGSRDLLTRPAEDEVLAALESAPPGEETPPVIFAGERLDSVLPGSGIAVPEEIFDHLALLQTPLEQAAYLHLFRLSFGEGRNWCRVGKRELQRRLGMSERRLNVVLDGLVSKGHVKPLHRNPRGTLYRVYLPAEIMVRAEEARRPAREEGAEGETAEDKRGKFPKGVPLSPPPLESSPPAPADTLLPPSPPPVRRERPLESPLNEERFAGLAGLPPPGPTVGEMADWFFVSRGQKPRPAERQLAITVLTGLLEDGFSRAEVQKALEWFRAHLPEEKNLDRLPYFITTALSQK